MSSNTILFREEARTRFLDRDGKVSWGKVAARYEELRKTKVSLGNKYFTAEVQSWAMGLSQEEQHRLLNVMVGGLANDDASVGVYATRPEDYVLFAPYLEPIIRDYHGISGDTVQQHDWDIPVGVYELTKIDPALDHVSMRARVARNVEGWNLPSSMNKDERLTFERLIVDTVIATLPFRGKYYSLTPGHSHEMSASQAEQMRRDHLLFNDMTTDNHLTASGIASDWPHGRGMWLSDDNQKMIWIGEEDHLRVISIVHGTDLGAVDKSLSDLLAAMEAAGIAFAKHPVYGIITTCPTNMGTGKRQSVLLPFPNLTKHGTDEGNLKAVAKSLGLQARGLAGEHSKMDENGMSDVSPMARFGVTEKEVTSRLYKGLSELLVREKECASV